MQNDKKKRWNGEGWGEEEKKINESDIGERKGGKLGGRKIAVSAKKGRSKSN